MSGLSNEIARFLKLEPAKATGSYRVVSITDMGKYRCSLIEYDDQEGSTIPAFLLEPTGAGPFPAVLIHHPHNGERHLGKSEVCGLAGNSYGGNTVLFQMAIETDLAFGCSSGAACTYANKIENQTGLEKALVIPNFLSKWEITDLVSSVSPRKLLLVSATEDKYAKDADVIFASAHSTFKSAGVGNNLVSKRYSGGHALTPERFDFIVDWIAGTA